MPNIPKATKLQFIIPSSTQWHLSHPSFFPRASGAAVNTLGRASLCLRADVSLGTSPGEACVTEHAGLQLCRGHSGLPVGDEQVPLPSGWEVPVFLHLGPLFRIRFLPVCWR